MLSYSLPPGVCIVIDVEMCLTFILQFSTGVIFVVQFPERSINLLPCSSVSWSIVGMTIMNISLVSNLSSLDTLTYLIDSLPDSTSSSHVSSDTIIIPTVHSQIHALILKTFDPRNLLVFNANNLMLSLVLMSGDYNSLLDCPLPLELVFKTSLLPSPAKVVTSLIVAFTLHSSTEISPSTMLGDPVIGEVSVGLPVSVKNVRLDWSLIVD